MTAKELGSIIRTRRKHLQMNQVDLALVSGTGVRFISDLENGKETCAIGKALKVLENLGPDPKTTRIYRRQTCRIGGLRFHKFRARPFTLTSSPQTKSRSNTNATLIPCIGKIPIPA